LERKGGLKISGYIFRAVLTNTTSLNRQFGHGLREKKWMDHGDLQNLLLIGIAFPDHGNWINSKAEPHGVLSAEKAGSMIGKLRAYRISHII
jgi:hypothetical protein